MGAPGSTTRRGTRRAPGNEAAGPSPRFVDVGLLLLGLFLVVLERRARGPLLEQDVERLLDVVGVQLLVEIDDIFLFVGLLGRLRRLATTTSAPRPRPRLLPRPRRRREAVVVVVVLEIVFVFEVRLVEGLLVELGLFLVEVVVAHGCSAPRGVSRKDTRGPPLRLATGGFLGRGGCGV